jgi:hypothetical protein
MPASLVDVLIVLMAFSLIGFEGPYKGGLLPQAELALLPYSLSYIIDLEELHYTTHISTIAL